MMYNISLPFQFESFVYFIIWGELSGKIVSQICHEKINKTLDGAHLTDFGYRHLCKLTLVMSHVSIMPNDWQRKKRGEGTNHS